MKLSTIMLSTLSLTAGMNASALTQGTAKLISHHESSTNPTLKMTLVDVANNAKQDNRLQAIQTQMNKQGRAFEGTEASVSLDPDVSVEMNQPVILNGFVNLFFQNDTPVTRQFTVQVEYCASLLKSSCSQSQDVYEIAPYNFVDIKKTATIENVYTKTGTDYGMLLVGISRDHSNRLFYSTAGQNITVVSNDRT